MKRLLTSTTIVSMAMMPMAPLPMMAQVMDDADRIIAADGTVLCEPTAELVCDLENEEIQKAAKKIQRDLDREAEAAAQVEAAAQAEAEAAAQAEAEAAAQAEADAAAQAEAEAAAQAEADAAAQAEADAAAQAEADAAEQVEADAAEQVEADAAAQADADAAAQAETATDAPTDAEIQAQTEAALAEGVAETTAADGTIIDPAAGLVAEETPIDPDAPLIDAPVVSDTEAEALSTLLVAPSDPNGETAPPAVAAPLDAPLPVIEADAGSDALIDPADAEAALNAIPVTENTVATTVETVTAAQIRSSSQEFKAAPKKTADGKKTGLSDLEKVGLFVLGAVVIGQVLNSIEGKSTVVSNTGDRVVVQNPDGSYGLYKDDDAILRQAGSTVRTETYNDGSSRTIVQRADGTQVVTVRDATGRVLRRAQYDRLGRELVLLDEFAPERPVNVADLPRPRVVGATRSEDAALRAAIAARQIEKLGRGFSWRQLRDIAEVRVLAAEVDVERVTFASGSAAITPEQANALADLGEVMQDMLVKNPAEMFLVEGHTDATGAAALNLALSDRRAESVALALSEYFAIPPENMIVQGYGETELRIDTQASEPQNRRVAVRLITPLLRPAS